MKRVLGIVVLLMATIAIAHAAVRVATFGRGVSGTYPMIADSDGNITINGGINKKTSAVAAGQTLASTDCGSTFVVSPSTTLTFNLPSVITGCEFKFIQTTGGAISKVVVNPTDANKLRGVVNSAATDTFALGDSTISAGNTNDSISVISSGDTIWDVSYIRGTWTDNN